MQLLVDLIWEWITAWSDAMKGYGYECKQNRMMCHSRKKMNR